MASCGMSSRPMASAAALTLRNTGRVEMRLTLGRSFFTGGGGG